MSENNFRDVGTFHHKFGLDHVDCDELCDLRNGSRFTAGDRHFKLDPRVNPLMQFRLKFLEEELKETIQGAAEEDHVKVFDGLLDLVYVALGTAHLLGYPWQEGWDEVQRANMTKERAASEADSRSTRKPSLDVVKPEGWRPPNIAGILRRFGWDV